MRVKAFSLIELMVVIAIIAVLAAIAVPAYKAYVIRAKIVVAIKAVSPIIEGVKENYIKNGTLSGYTTVFNGVTVGSGHVNVNNFANIYMIQGDFYGAVPPDGAWTMQVLMNGLEGIPGYESPTVDAPWAQAHHQEVFFAIRNIDGMIVTKCGTISPGHASAIPIEYLPAGCKCANVGAWTTGGSC